MPDLVMTDPSISAAIVNVFDRLVTNWDRKTLQRAMDQAKQSIPQIFPLSFRFLNHIRHYHCRLFRSGNRYFIEGCQVELRHIHLANYKEKMLL